jgi:hypothetical protein
MSQAKTARVRMLGNAFELLVGQVYDLPIERANGLCGLGYAVMVSDADSSAEEDDDGL